MKLAIGKILGNTEEKNWGQVYDFTPEEGVKMSRRGRLIAVISIREGENPAGMPIIQAGKEILSRLHELYYGELEMGGLERLKIATTEIEEEFPGVEIVSTAFIDGVIYVAATPGVGIWVCCGDKEGWLVNRENKIGMITASGWAKQGEVLVMGNSIFWENITTAELKSAVAALDGGMENVVETLAAIEHATTKVTGQVGAVIQVGDISTDGEEVVPEIIEVKKETAKFKVSWKERGQKLWGKIKSGTENKGVYVINGENPQEKKRRKKTAYVGIVLIMMWVGLAAVGQVRSRKIADEQSGENKAVEMIQSQYQEASAVVGLNPTRSKELLAQIQQEIDGLGSLGKKDARIAEINKGYGDVLGAATGTKTAVIKEVQDLSLARDGVDASRLAMGENNKLWILDKKGNRIFGVDINNGSANVLAGQSDLGQAKLISTYPGKIEALSDKGIVECLSANNQCSVKIKPDGEWQNILGMKVWAANIYLLDGGAKQIWKYSGNESGFGTRQAWLAEKDDALGQSLSMAIDGNVWILLSNGTIRKYTQGVGENITINGMDKAVGDGAVIFTDDNQDKLYILDPKNNRVVAVNKSGEYASQWKSDKFGEMKDVVVDEKAGRMWLVGGSDVIEVSL